MQTGLQGLTHGTVICKNAVLLFNNGKHARQLQRMCLLSGMPSVLQAARSLTPGAQAAASGLVERREGEITAVENSVESGRRQTVPDHQN